MSKPGLTHQASRWMYRGIWGVLVRWFRVPSKPPTLPDSTGAARAFQPSESFLRYLQTIFWVVMLLIDGAILLVWLSIAANSPRTAWILAVPFLILAIIPDIIAYIAIHLRYDTTWYVMSDRSVRIRRGIWTISEVTVTYDNVQNVAITQGPLQRWFGFSNLEIETAGGGGGGAKGKAGAHPDAHSARIEGIENAQAIRDLIMERVRLSRSAGLGDDAPHRESSAQTGAWTPQSLDVLREIREFARGLST